MNIKIRFYFVNHVCHYENIFSSLSSFQNIKKGDHIYLKFLVSKKNYGN